MKLQEKCTSSCFFVKPIAKHLKGQTLEMYCKAIQNTQWFIQVEAQNSNSIGKIITDLRLQKKKLIHHTSLYRLLQAKLSVQLGGVML